jgi:CRP-like cAMP-binding protein
MDKHMILAACAITRDLPDVNRSALATRAEFVSAEPGTVILEQGAVADSAYIVVEGAVQVFMRSPGGDEIVLARLETGNNFGEQAILAGCRRNRLGAGAVAHDTAAPAGPCLAGCLPPAGVAGRTR